MQLECKRHQSECRRGGVEAETDFVWAICALVNTVPLDIATTAPAELILCHVYVTDEICSSSPWRLEENSSQHVATQLEH